MSMASRSPCKSPFLDKGRSEVRHDEIADEHHALIRQIDEHCVMRLPSLHGDQFDAGSSDLQLGPAIDCDIGLEATNVFEVEEFTKKSLAKNPRSV